MESGKFDNAGTMGSDVMGETPIPVPDMTPTKAAMNACAGLQRQLRNAVFVPLDHLAPNFTLSASGSGYADGKGDPVPAVQIDPGSREIQQMMAAGAYPLSPRDVSRATHEALVKAWRFQNEQILRQRSSLMAMREELADKNLRIAYLEQVTADMEAVLLAMSKVGPCSKPIPLGTANHAAIPPAGVVGAAAATCAEAPPPTHAKPLPLRAMR